MAESTVGQFRLANDGAFVVKMRFDYIDSGGNRHETPDCTGGIVVKKSDTVNPGNCGVPNGAQVSLHADVVWGKDNEATQVFTYQQGSPAVAVYTISGVTQNNTLKFEGIEG